MKKPRIIAFLMLAAARAPEAWACPWCTEEVRNAVYTPEFTATAFLLSFPLLVVVLVGAALHMGDRGFFHRRYVQFRAVDRPAHEADAKEEAR